MQKKTYQVCLFKSLYALGYSYLLTHTLFNNGCDACTAVSQLFASDQAGLLKDGGTLSQMKDILFFPSKLFFLKVCSCLLIDQKQAGCRGKTNIFQRSLIMRRANSLRYCKGFWAFVMLAGGQSYLFIMCGYVRVSVFNGILFSSFSLHVLTETYEDFDSRIIEVSLPFPCTEQIRLTQTSSGLLVSEKKFTTIIFIQLYYCYHCKLYTKSGNNLPQAHLK